MMRDNRARRLPMTISALIALGLTVVPLPAVLNPFRPDFLVLVVLFWSIGSPRSGGLSLPFIAGLALDVINVPRLSSMGTSSTFGVQYSPLLSCAELANIYCSLDQQGSVTIANNESASCPAIVPGC